MIASPSFLLLSIIQNIRFGKRTAAFLIFGYAIGLLLPVAILSASNYELYKIKNQMMTDADRIIRLEMQTLIPSANTGRQEQLMFEIELFRQLQALDSSIESVSFKSEFSSVLFDGHQYRYVNVVTIDPSFTDHFRRFVKRGEGFHDGDTGKCIIGSTLSRQLWNGSSINKVIQVGGMTCTIAGETDLFDKFVVLKETGQKNLKGKTHFFVKVKDAHDVDTVLAKIHQMNGQWRTDRMDIVHRQSLQHMYAGFSVIVLLSFVTLFYALLNIGYVIGLMQSERRTKYGVQLALGASKRTILGEFFGEMMIITTIAALLVFIALKMGQPIIERYLFSIRLDYTVMLFATVANTAICGILGLIFIRRIWKTSIVRLIRESDG